MPCRLGFNTGPLILFTVCYTVLNLNLGKGLEVRYETLGHAVPDR